MVRYQSLALAGKVLRVSQGALEASGKPTMGNNKGHESKNTCSLKSILKIHMAYD